MKAIVYRSFGGPEALRWEEIEKPVPGKGEVLVRVEAASVNPLDWHMVRGTPRLMRLAMLREPRPLRPGRDFSGIVEQVGPGVENLHPGDAVLGASQGAFAEYLSAPATAMVRRPDGLSPEAAAAIPIAGLTALQALRDGGMHEGATVLVNGAAGGVGTFAVQLAKWMGGVVVAVCAPDARGLVERLGADEIVDYTRDDFTAAGPRYDLIIDTAGNHRFPRLARALKPDGQVVAVGGGAPMGRKLGRWLLRSMLSALATRFSRRKFRICMSRLDLDELGQLAQLPKDGIVVPVVTARYPLAEAADALRIVASGHARGKVILIP